MKKMFYVACIAGTMMLVENISYRDGSIVERYYRYGNVVPESIKVIIPPYHLQQGDVLISKKA